ncbi:MFS transporter [Kibdelosporangium philippinense]|uniref:Multidrug efflux pump Tap n=1 Tax=Kibdelosporangium philippinense TaxID=211113 RepID=A0ABS9A062_9PSEU|nr:MFS transporter [Kibdelosporangium philippinense]MCE7012132.1 MFS transporter [Kibdelosporangium philippinense]
MIAVIGLLSATGLSVAGNAITGIAIPWLVLERTGSPGLAGLLAAAALGPLALSTLFGGALIDRWGRRRLSIIADIFSALAVAALPILDSTLGLNTALIAILVALGALFDGPGMAARESLRPDVARHAKIPLERVNAWGEAIEGLGNIVAPGLAALFIALAGATNTLWVTVGMFFGAVVLTRLTVPRDTRHAAPDHYFRSVAEGFTFVWRQPILRGAGLSAMLLILFVAPISIVLTAQAQSMGNPGLLGLVMTMFGVGGIVGAIVYGAIATKLRRRPVLLWGLVITGVGLMLFASGIPMAVLAALVGVAAAPINPITAVLIQERTPERLRGRVIGSIASLALIAGPIGVSLTGALLEGASAGLAFVLMGAGCLLAALYSAFALRDIEARTGLPGNESSTSDESRTTKEPLTSK